MKLKLLKDALLTSVLAIVLSLVPMAAFAEDGSSGSGGSSGDSNSNTSLDSGGADDASGPGVSGDQLPGMGGKHLQEVESNQKELLKMRMEDALHAEGGGALNGTDLTKCDVRAAKINAIMGRIVLRGTKQTELFTTIATRVENFYTSKSLSLSNYDALVAAVNDAAAKAQTDLSTLKSNSTFTCDSTNPKGQISEFRTALQTEIQDLKALKTSVKDLIVGVKSVAGSDNSNSSTDTGTNTSTSGGTQ